MTPEEVGRLTVYQVKILYEKNSETAFLTVMDATRNQIRSLSHVH